MGTSLKSKKKKKKSVNLLLVLILKTNLFKIVYFFVTGVDFYKENPLFFSFLFPCRRFGIMGLYKGLEAKLLQTVLTAALMFLVYEKLTATTFMVMGLKRASKR